MKYALVLFAALATTPLSATHPLVFGQAQPDLPSPQIAISNSASVLFDVLPCVTSDYIGYASFSNSKLVCQCFDRSPRAVVFVSTTNVTNNASGQFVIPSLLTTRNPLFQNLVNHVVEVGAQEEMVRIDTRRIVAMVTDKKSVGNWTKHHLVRHAMGKQCCRGFRAFTFNTPIAAQVDVAIPQYATAFGLLPDGIEKPMSERLFATFKTTIIVLFDMGRLSSKSLSASLTGTSNASRTALHAEPPIQVQCVGADVFKHARSAILGGHI